MHVCMYVCVYVCLCVCVYVCMCVCMRYEYVCMHVFMYVCMYVCMCVHVCFNLFSVSKRGRRRPEQRWFLFQCFALKHGFHWLGSPGTATVGFSGWLPGPRGGRGRDPVLSRDSALAPRWLRVVTALAETAICDQGPFGCITGSAGAPWRARRWLALAPRWHRVGSVLQWCFAAAALARVGTALAPRGTPGWDGDGRWDGRDESQRPQAKRHQGVPNSYQI